MTDLKKLHESWIERGVPSQLVHAYEYCVHQSRSWNDEYDQASLILVDLIGVFLGDWKYNLPGKD